MTSAFKNSLIKLVAVLRTIPQVQYDNIDIPRIFSSCEWVKDGSTMICVYDDILSNFFLGLNMCPWPPFSASLLANRSARDFPSTLGMIKHVWSVNILRYPNAALVPTI